MKRVKDLWAYIKPTLAQILNFLLDLVGLVIVAIVIWLLVQLANDSNPNRVNLLLKAFSWPHAIVLFVVIFIFPIFRILRNLAAKLSTASKVKIGEVELHTETLENIIVEREKLRTGIYMASIDGKPEQIELEYLRTIEREMPNRLNDLAKDNFFSVLETAIQVSLIDKEFHLREYQALQDLAWRFDITKEDLDRKIIDALVEKHILGIKIKLPSEIAIQFNQAKILRGVV